MANGPVNIPPGNIATGNNAPGNTMPETNTAPEKRSTPEMISKLSRDARLLAIEVLLADPEALENDALEGDLYILRDTLRAQRSDQRAQRSDQ